MKKPVYVRIVLLLLLYAAVFTAIVMIQFPKQGLFTQHIGSMIITGQHRLPDQGGPVPVNGRALLTGRASVFFGGMEFCLGPGAEGSALRFFGEDGRAEDLLPEALFVSADTAVFRFPGGMELSFTAYSGRNLELRMSCTFSGDFDALELPFRPLRRTVIGSSGAGGLSVNSDGLDYTFGPANPDTARFVLLFLHGGPSLSYRGLVEREPLSIDDFVLPEGQSWQDYNTAVGDWLDRNYAVWDRMVRGQNDEDLVVAFAAEAINRNEYDAALSAIPPAFLNGNHRTYESSVYLGGLDQAAVSLRAAEQAKFSRISQQINDSSLDFFMEDRAFEYLAVRGNDRLINGGAEVIASFDTEELTMELIPGILEAYNGWKSYRPNTENPFIRFINKMETVIFGALKLMQNGSRVFVCADNYADIEYNIRLGKALLAWAESEGEDSWAALARSLIVSSLLEGEEALGTGFFITEEDEMIADPNSPEISTARLYRSLYPNADYPKALAVSSGTNPVWVWTAVPALQVTAEGNAMDIAVDFFAGETHYMIFQGIPAFDRVQLYGMDFRTDPQFERYDSSGWAYTGANQTLMVKMRHRNTTERIRIYF